MPQVSLTQFHTHAVHVLLVWKKHTHSSVSLGKGIINTIFAIQSDDDDNDDDEEEEYAY